MIRTSVTLALFLSLLIAGLAQNDYKPQRTVIFIGPDHTANARYRWVDAALLRASAR